MKNMMKYLLVTQSLMPIQSGTFFCRPWSGLFLDALVAVLEADEQHDDGNDGVEDGNLNPCLLGITQTGNQQEGYCGDDHVAEGDMPVRNRLTTARWSVSRVISVASVAYGRFSAV